MQRRRAGSWRGWMLAGLLLGAAGQQGRAEVSGPPTSLGAELVELASAANTVFVGQIVSIVRQPGWVEIRFCVEQPVRGPAGQVFVLREWAGLWPPGHFRYTVGQRVLAFLHGAGGAGFSSPVHGAEGLIPVLVQGADAPELLDIRRLAAAVLRAPGEPLPTAENGAIQLADALAIVQGASAGDVPRQRLPLRGAPPTNALERLVSEPAQTSSGLQRPASSGPIVRRASDARH